MVEPPQTAGLYPGAPCPFIPNAGHERMYAPAMATPTYDPERHILLRDQAHKRRIHEDAEFAEFLRRLETAAYLPDDPDARITAFDVMVPEWPPAPRSPLAIIFGGDDPFADKPWRGRQPAVERDWWTDRETFRIARDMVSPERDFDPDRLAYQWQVPMFDPARHIVMRRWCNENGVDLVAFLRGGAESVGLRLFETTNPHIREERKRNRGYSPTRRCFDHADLPLARRAAGLDASTPAPAPEPEVDDVVWVIGQLDRDDRSLWTRRGPPRVRAIEALLGRQITATQRDAAWKIARQAPAPAPAPEPDEGSDSAAADGVREISPDDAVAALRATLGRDFRLFGGQTADRRILAMSRKALKEWLAEDPTSSAVYVHEKRGRNYDCDDFAMALKVALAQSNGLNGCAIVWGDGHAWCAFFVHTDAGAVQAVMVEPQTDVWVTECRGSYAVEQRCEVYL